MEIENINLSSIIVEPRKRPVDTAVVAEIAQSIKLQGLLQNVGVKLHNDAYRLVFGAHRLEAVRQLGWEAIPCLVFPSDLSDDECLLAELQENNARKELTGAERKAFAAEVGRLSQKLFDQSNSTDQSNFDQRWLIDLAEKSGLTKQTAYNWWSAFCKSAGLTITPKQATATDKQAFFAWLEAQQQQELQDKAAKEAADAAEKQRKQEEAQAKRMQSEHDDLIAYLDDVVAHFGYEVTRKWVSGWLTSRKKMLKESSSQ